MFGALLPEHHAAVGDLVTQRLFHGLGVNTYKLRNQHLPGNLATLQGARKSKQCVKVMGEGV